MQKKKNLKPNQKHQRHTKVPNTPPPISHSPQKKPHPKTTTKNPNSMKGIQCGPCTLSDRSRNLSSTADHMSTPANNASCSSLPAAGWAMQACCCVFCGAHRFLGLQVLGFHFSFRSVKGSAGIGPNCPFAIPIFSL